MVAVSGMDVAWPIFALAALIAAASMFVLVWRRGFKSLHAEIGKANVTLEAVNKAVNNVPPGTPPLPQRMKQVEEDLREIKETLAAMGPVRVIVAGGGNVEA